MSLETECVCVLGGDNKSVEIIFVRNKGLPLILDGLQIEYIFRSDCKCWPSW